MRVNIDKQGKKLAFNMIDSWNDVTMNKLERLLAYQDLPAIQKGLNIVNLFSDIPKDIIKTLSITDVAKLLTYVEELQAETDGTHKATFTLNGIRYGFIPSLEDISLGEYADIETFIKDGVEKNLANIMSVLFRPIIEETEHYYIIEAYNGATQKARRRLFMDMSAVQVHNSMVFFWSFVNKLYQTFKLSLVKKMSQKEKIEQL